MNAVTQIAPATVNGVAVNDVRALIEAVSADPAVGMTRWSVANTWQGRFHSRGQVESFEIGGQPVARRFSIDVDEPEQLGGANRFANPQEYLLAALNACMTVGFTALCALNGYEIESLRIVTEGDIDLRGFFGLDASVSPGYDRLDTTVTVKGSASPAEFQAVFEAMLATSPNLHNISKPIDVRPRLIVA
jgi:uncharacterized OsmC-like protein